MENPAALLHAGDFERLNAGVQAATDVLAESFPNHYRSTVEGKVWGVLFAFHRTVRDYKNQDGSS
jgi:hypothetical protein